MKEEALVFPNGKVAQTPSPGTQLSDDMRERIASFLQSVDAVVMCREVTIVDSASGRAEARLCVELRPEAIPIVAEDRKSLRNTAVFDQVNGFIRSVVPAPLLDCVQIANSVGAMMGKEKGNAFLDLGVIIFEDPTRRV